MSARLACAVVLASLALASVPAHANKIPPIQAVGVDERVGTQLPLATPFTAAGQGPVTLGTYVDGTRPVLLVLAYARCTMLCSLVLRGVVEVARKMALVAGRDYQLVLVGLDSHETIDEASRKQAALLADLDRHDDRASWPYLIGTRAGIDAVADALGFRYAWDPRTEQYAHPAVIFALTPDGKVSRYLHGLQFDPGEVTTALTDAAAGKVITTEASAILRCFRFDPASRTVGARAEKVLQIGAAGIFAMLVTSIAGLIVWERRRARRARDA
ncbi:MAG: SCO family protein [Deltaproteobacteria bacterium]|nr:SCO family protein [Deltaproteobacteria bacterium]